LPTLVPGSSARTFPPRRGPGVPAQAAAAGQL